MVNLGFRFGGLDTKAAWFLFRLLILFSSQFLPISCFLWIWSFSNGAQSSTPVNVELVEEYDINLKKIPTQHKNDETLTRLEMSWSQIEPPKSLL